MGNISTEAWVLYSRQSDNAYMGLKKEKFEFSTLDDYEVLAEPLLGSWDANLTHAIERNPIDVCQQRGEEKIVLGNTGIVRILKTGSKVTTSKEGDCCLVFPNAVWDRYGYPIKAYAYDAPHTIGLLAKQTKMHEMQVIPLPPNQHPLSYAQWASFSGRYVTAWSNWEVAYGCWRLQVPEEECPNSQVFVWGWGGGTSFAELTLAQHFGCQAAMISSDKERINTISQMGMTPIDRRLFPNLSFDEDQYRKDPDFARLYQESEKNFLDIVREETNNNGVSIFIDNLGTPVFRATLKALGRQGVISTVGWKLGMKINHLRALECINRHTHVHTHFARYQQGVAAVKFAQEMNWAPPIDSPIIYSWDDIPGLVDDYANGKISTYFPMYQVNELS